MTSRTHDALDVVIIGAGLSGINAAYRLQTQLPHLSYALLEARDVLGGTWSYWKYPGVRTDSSAQLYCYPWHPLDSNCTMPDASTILRYMTDAAESQGIKKNIRYSHRVTRAAWSTEEHRWDLSVHVSHKGENGELSSTKRSIKAWWVISCSGYYDYEKPLPAVIPGIEKFNGEVIHPQFWPEKAQYAGKRVVVIGSGATAVTLIPVLAKTAESVTMLQRSPGYVLSLPSQNHVSSLISRLMPRSLALLINWWRSMILETLFIEFVTRFPRLGNRIIKAQMRYKLPRGFDVERHFSPRYNVLEQRLCFCPDDDFFAALHRPNCHVVTDRIETVSESGILLESGQHLDANLIITATGLLLAPLARVQVLVDGLDVKHNFSQRYAWHGIMLEGVPNMGLVMGYAAATWTPGADARTRLMLRIMKHMEKIGALAAAPYMSEEQRKKLPRKPYVNLNSTYVTAAAERMPATAEVGPWKNTQRWFIDVWNLVSGNLEDGMRYTGKRVVNGKPKTL